MLIVGPSGAGKDTLIDGARRQLAGCSGITFATRVVTRPATAFEAHDSMSEQDFNNAAAQGAFCLSWSAHGLAYGLSASLDDRLLSGEIVVANVSRAIVAAARRRFAEVRVVYITAPAAVLAARRAARGREGAPAVIESRVMRAAIDDERSAADLVIENVGPPQGGIALLSDFLVGLGARLS